MNRIVTDCQLLLSHAQGYAQYVFDKEHYERGPD